MDDNCPYEVKHSEELGRYLVASKDLDARTIIIRECPLACSPADDPHYEDFGGIPMCLGCCARLSQSCRSRCSKCTWPVCSTDCQIMKHHRENECSFFQSHQVKYTDFKSRPLINETLFIFRCLLLKDRSPEVWEDIMLKFEHHTKIRQSKAICKEKDEKVLENLRDLLQGTQLTFQENEIILLSGIINVNAFSSTKLEDECTRRVRKRMTIAQCLYPTASLLAHCCVPNAIWTISSSPNFQITIRTSVPVKKGETITIGYATRELMYGTLQRLVSTEEIAHFICKCHRCEDPTELSTFVSALRCHTCSDDDNFILPLNPTDAESIWKCQACNDTLKVGTVVKILRKIESQFENIKNASFTREEEVEELESLYCDHESTVLHENHFLLQDISLRIVNRQALNVYNLEIDELDRFLFHCQRLLNVADVHCPGYCRHRALLQFYIAQALSIQAKQFPNKDSNLLIQQYQRIYKLQKEAFLYFRNEGEDNNGTKRATGINQYVACLVEEMQDTARAIANLGHK